MSDYYLEEMCLITPLLPVMHSLSLSARLRGEYRAIVNQDATLIHASHCNHATHTVTPLQS